MRFFSHSADKSKDTTLLKELVAGETGNGRCLCQLSKCQRPGSDRLLYLQKPRCLETLPVSPSSGAGRITSPIVVS